MKRFRVKLRDEFDSTLLPYVEEVFHSDNLLRAIVHGHLLLERAITTLIAQKMRRPNVLENRTFGRWSFHQKLGLYVGLYDPPEERQKMLLAFNKLRNAMAHSLGDDDTTVFECLPWGDESRPPNARTHVWAVTAILFFELGILQGIERLEKASALNEAPSADNESYLSGRVYRSVLNQIGRSQEDAMCRLTGQLRSVCNCDQCREERLGEDRLLGGTASDDRSKAFDTDRPRIQSDMDQTLELYFLHPRDSAKSVTADVSPQCSGQEALHALSNFTADHGEAAFLPTLPQGETYELIIHRTRHRIELQMSFEEAGAIDGDWIDIQRNVCLGL